MSLLTIFTAPKPFEDAHIDTIQLNAIQSCLALGADVQVILIGDETGMAEVASEYDLLHLPEVACNEHGTPLVSSIFDLARQASDSALLAYVNADIILLPDFLEVARNVHGQISRFLLVGQRWDLDLTQPLDFSGDWQQDLQKEVQQRGSLHQPAGSDYFIFPRELYTDMPPFAIGRAGWDNWMIYHGVQQPWPVIDATEDIMIIHQNHDYRHMPDGKVHYGSEETLYNAKLGGGMQNMYMVLDTNKELRGSQIRNPRPRLIRLLRRLERALQPPGDEIGGGLRWWLTRRLRRWRRAIVGSRKAT
ncbi:MAG: hypothetical protein DWQ07_10540 [Chloroflexi bacterium]|nr:MAG: hypothetical protein DWQ07_10540 [Chloroflexota bacterium]MBL1192850.1 hypothetical protein [Chloroflexota bacterium]NOH10143.1 hypothetical protein [Chloroflexota bacterium]